MPNKGPSPVRPPLDNQKTHPRRTGEGPPSTPADKSENTARGNAAGPPSKAIGRLSWRKNTAGGRPPSEPENTLWGAPARPLADWLRPICPKCPITRAAPCGQRSAGPVPSGRESEPHEGGVGRAPSNVHPPLPPQLFNLPPLSGPLPVPAPWPLLPPPSPLLLPPSPPLLLPSPPLHIPVANHPLKRALARGAARCRNATRTLPCPPCGILPAALGGTSPTCGILPTTPGTPPAPASTPPCGTRHRRVKCASAAEGGTRPAPLGCPRGAAIVVPDTHRSDTPTTIAGGAAASALAAESVGAAVGGWDHSDGLCLSQHWPKLALQRVREPQKTQTSHRVVFRQCSQPGGRGMREG